MAESSPFQSILFPPGREQFGAENREEPECFRDLNLDQLVKAILLKRNAKDLLPLFYSTYREPDIVLYRQEVFRQLEHEDTLEAVVRFRESMHRTRLDLHYAGKIEYLSHRWMVVLGAAARYCEALEHFSSAIQSVDAGSRGFAALSRYLAAYLRSSAFLALAEETAAMADRLSSVQYCLLVRGDRVLVRKYASEADYALRIRKQFARFRTARAEDDAAKGDAGLGMNHIEEGILDLVARLYPDHFSALEKYAARHGAFIDPVIERFDREVDFFLSYLAFIKPLRQAALPFCYPDVSPSDKAIACEEGFDLALAAKLVKEGKKIVRNDFRLHGKERIIVVSGPNQGGKTTFARMFGQLHFLAGLGCPVPARRANLFLADRVLTHFEREEDVATLRGKLEDDLVRMHGTVSRMTGDSVVILNEIFNSTSLRDQVFLSRRIIERIVDADALSVCVSFIDELSTMSEKTASMVSTVVPDDPAVRTFKIVRKPADGLAYALSLAEKHGLTYALLRRRISS